MVTFVVAAIVMMSHHYYFQVTLISSLDCLSSYSSSFLWSCSWSSADIDIGRRSSRRGGFISETSTGRNKFLKLCCSVFFVRLLPNSQQINKTSLIIPALLDYQLCWIIYSILGTFLRSGWFICSSIVSKYLWTTQHLHVPQYEAYVKHLLVY